MTQLGGPVTPEQAQCSTCGALEEPQKKWNSGNPKVIMFPTCTCAEDAERELVGPT